MKNICFAIIAVFCLIACQSQQDNSPANKTVSQTLSQQGENQQGMIAAAHPLATQAGIAILEKGGNAVDAAVASAFALAVVEPSMSGLGGRLQAIVHLPDGEVRGIDATTQAPMSYDAATAPKGSYGYATIGIPGVVAGLTSLSDAYGNLTLEEVMAPAISYAEEGFALLPGEAARHAMAVEELLEFDGSRQYFIVNDSLTRTEGTLLVQPDLAATLKAIAKGGADAFYRGAIAQQIIADIQANGGVLDMEDLANYRALDAEILHSSYRGYDFYALSMPSYGAITLEIMNILENMPMQEVSEADWAANMYLAIERAYQDRGKQYADSIGILISKEYARQAAEEIMEMSPVSRLERLGDVPASWLADVGHTTHLSTADSSGMMVALTQSLGPNMGSKVATPGLGFLYAVTLGGYLGEFEPGQRAASHISPVVISRKGQPFMALGAAGGSRIISAITSVSSRVIDRNLPLFDALAAPRVHPDDADSVLVETHEGMGWQDEILQAMEERGMMLHEVDDVARFGRVHAVQFDQESGIWIGAADPDWEGAAGGPN
jgi:gamma-glutamyltranspeptidase/glutathione hydrolase